MTMLRKGTTPTMLVDRYFGEVVRLLPDGSAILRPLDGGPDARLNAAGSLRLGSALRVGARLEFEIKRGHDGDLAFDATTLDAGYRRAGGERGGERHRHA